MIAVFGLLGCIGITPGGQGYTITVPMGMINSTVRANFPQHQKTDYGTLTIDKPNILGKQGSDKLAIGTAFSFSNMLIPNGIKGMISLSSGVRYNASNRGLYLTSPMIDDIKFHNFALSSYMTPEMRNLIGNLITQQLLSKPIYHINNIGASLVRNIEVVDGNVVLGIGL
jgi:hypothetical protein